MIIQKRYKEVNGAINYDDLEAGSIVEFSGWNTPNSGPIMLKLCNNESVLLSFSDHLGTFQISDGSIPENHRVKCVHGKLVGLIVE